MAEVAVLATGALEGRVAVVTGGGSGIGRAIAARLNQLGATVVGIGRRADALHETGLLCDEPARFEALTCDVRDVGALSAAVGGVGDRLGIDVLVNNAGGQFFAPATAISPRGWRSVVELNLDAVFWACRAAYPYLAASGRGCVTNMSLSGVERGGMGMAHSIAARSGVLGLTRTLALEWAPERIRLNCIGPGTVATPTLANSSDAVVLDRLLAATPLGRFTEPAEVAELVAFLASGAGAMITGQLLQVDGGASLGPGLHMIAQEHG